MLPNASWPITSCRDCTTKMCNDYITSQGIREETAKLFEGMGEGSQDINYDECQVISVLEAATCTSRACKRTATIKSECYNRNEPLIKYSIISFVLTTVVALVFGLIKNHIPAFQSLNETYFNY